MNTIDFTRYRCEKCGKQGVCEEAMDVFVACLCQACFEALWHEYVDTVTQQSNESINMEVIGYTHSSGHILCPVHAEYGAMRDAGNETGYVCAILDGDEFDFIPTCDVCGEEIDSVTLLQYDIRKKLDGNT